MMTKEQAIITSKLFRQQADQLLQQMKVQRLELLACHSIDAKEGDPERFLDPREVIAQHTLSIRDLESCIMRQGMALKYIGTPTPYPHSKDPTNTIVEPTADGLKM
jgi:hypothetical protein